MVCADTGVDLVDIVELCGVRRDARGKLWFGGSFVPAKWDTGAELRGEDEILEKGLLTVRIAEATSILGLITLPLRLHRYAQHGLLWLHLLIQNILVVSVVFY